MIVLPAHFSRKDTTMLSATVRLILVVLVFATLVHGGRRFSGRRPYPVSKPTSSRTKLLNLKMQVDLCKGKFLCDVRTVNSLCQLECIDENKACDGTMDCNNGRDEMNCQVPTCPSCPEETPCPGCPEETPCPSCPEETPCPSCPEETPCPPVPCATNQVLCGDMVTCITVSQACDGEQQCPPGDSVDESLDLCGPCPAHDDTRDGMCGVEPSDSSLIVEIADISSQTLCRDYCNVNPDCKTYAIQDDTGVFNCFLYSDELAPYTGACDTNEYVIYPCVTG